MSNQQKPDLAAEGRHNRVLGQRLALFRTAAGLRLADVAGATGIGLQLVQKYESGEMAVPFGRLVRLSEVLKVPLSMLIGNRFDEGVREQVESAAVMQIARIAGRLPLAKRRALVDMARELGRP